MTADLEPRSRDLKVEWLIMRYPDLTNANFQDRLSAHLQECAGRLADSRLKNEREVLQTFLKEAGIVKLCGSRTPQIRMASTYAEGLTRSALRDLGIPFLEEAEVRKSAADMEKVQVWVVGRNTADAGQGVYQGS
eukprot:s5353_g5.t1